MRSLNSFIPEWRSFVALWALCLAASLTASAQTFETLLSFNGNNGAAPYSGLAQARNGSLWGTTTRGGADDAGTIFRMTPNGTLSATFDFTPALGSDPTASLTLGADNYFYGTAVAGGTDNGGIVFKVSPGGVVTALYNFNPPYNPGAPITIGPDGNFYSTTISGGSTACDNGCGTVFQLTTGGTLTTIYEFDLTDGAEPYSGVVVGPHDELWGTAYVGGNQCAISDLGCGTIYRITNEGSSFTVVHYFSGYQDGGNPEAGLVLGTDGNLYGTTVRGGKYNDGTIFVITPTGKLTTLWQFSGPDGGYPNALMQGTDGNFYGTTGSGGAASTGTVFQITPSGVLTTLGSFNATTPGLEGGNPVGPLVQHTNGVFYGTTSGGNGTVFSLDMGLGAFIRTVTAGGKVGTQVEILGQGFTGTTSVTFNGTPATTFTVDTDTYLTAIVPAGATTGLIQVITPSGTLTSNMSFGVAE